MHLKSIITLGVLLSCICLAEVKAENDSTKGAKDTTTPPKVADVITADATAKDIRKVDCSLLTVKQLDALKEPKACAGLTASCMKKFVTTDINGACLENVPAAEWKKLDPQTVAQISKSSVQNLSLTPERFKDIFEKLKLDDLPAGFTGYVVRDNELLEVVFKTSDLKVIKVFLTADNIASLDLRVFRRLSAELIASLPDDAFSKVKSTQLALIPASSFTGFTAKQWANVPPAALLGLSCDQTKKLKPTCLNSMTPQQISNFGQSTAAATKLAAKSATTDNTQAILDRRQFKTKHPCSALPTISKDLTDVQRKALEERCKEVAAFNVNNAVLTSASLLLTGALMTVALVPAFL